MILFLIGCGVILMLGLFSLYLDFKDFVKQEELEEQQSLALPATT
jgi:hypothetical protein